MIEAVLSVGGIALAAGLGLGFAARKLHVEVDPVVAKIEEILPGGNCGNCGYPGCGAYAAAVGASEVAITLCTPGGKVTMEQMALIMGVSPAPMGDGEGPQIALIHEERCIGCTACIKACPVEAIVGANKQSHTVLASWCTGCGGCVEPCPVDCIEMVTKQITLYDWSWAKPVGPAGCH